MIHKVHSNQIPRLFCRLLVLLIATIPTYCRAQTDAAPYGTNGSVAAIVRSGNTIYIGGNFTAIVKNQPYAAAVDNSTGATPGAFPKANGFVGCYVPDGTGGWYVGGSFTTLGGYPRSGLAQINSSGQVTSWDPSITGGAVSAILVAGSTVYAAGNFTSVNANATPKMRSCLAAFDATVATNNATSWDPSVVGGSIFTLGISGTTLYAGGSFTAVNANATVKARKYLAAFDRTVATDNATAWDPSVDNTVNALVVSGTTLYAGGEFFSVNTNTVSKNRSYLAAFATNMNLNNATTWDPSTSGPIRAMVLNDTTIYVGGSFTSVNQQAPGPAVTRNRLAAFSTQSAVKNVTSWNPSLSAPVYKLHLSGTTLYASGGFSFVNTNATSKLRQGIAAFDITTATNNATAWGPTVDGQVYALAASGSSVYLGGDFTWVTAASRNYLAALDASTGMPTSWDPSVDNPVSSLATAGGTVYAGGYFTLVNTNATLKSRPHLAAFDSGTATNNATAWTPDVSGPVGALAIAGTTLYAGGSFGAVNNSTTSKSRGNLAAFDRTVATNNATAWDPSLNGSVSTLALVGNTLYAGGDFTAVNTNATWKMRNRLASFDLTTATDNATAWDPSVGGAVYALALSGTTVYVGGDFTAVNTNATSKTRNGLAAFNTGSATNNATAWDPSVNGLVTALAISGQTVYASGFFNGVNINATLKPRPYLAAFDATAATNNATAWAPVMGNLANALFISGSTIYAGGLFKTVNGAPAAYFTGINSNGIPLPQSLLRVSARATGATNTVAWETAGGASGATFAVERSTSGTDFAPIGTVFGTEANDYSFTDQAVVPVAYYRLAVSNLDGSRTYSAVASVRRDAAATAAATAYPQPATNTLTLTTTDASQYGRAAVVNDLQGREVYRFTVAPTVILDVAGWNPGVYVVRFPDGTVLRMVR